ncbi:MAG: glycosyltransferase N-terminal domain-containing protein [Bacteroidales bacterium]
MKILYNIGIRFYYLVVLVVSVWNSKAAKWIAGRRRWEKELTGKFSEGDQVVWFHCASLGEFEQGRPIIEMVREQFPKYKILLTFFSPSGYEKRKNFAAADAVCYLPLDTRSNARKFLAMVPVQKAIFIKYEFWYHFLHGLNRQGIPVYLASGHFSRSHLLFRWYAGWYRKFLQLFTHIFVQDPISEELLRSRNIDRVSVAGDTRFDRVVAINGKGEQREEVSRFVSGLPLVIAGSTWEKDEVIIRQVRDEFKGRCKWIIAPHEPSRQNVRRLQEYFPDHLLFSKLDRAENVNRSDVLIVDTIGHLSSLYRFGSLSYIGGGFGKGIHNILEATAAGLPVLFGPNFQRFREAVEMQNAGAAYVVEHQEDALIIIGEFLNNSGLLKERSQIALNYTVSRTGATKKIVDFVFKSNG